MQGLVYRRYNRFTREERGGLDEQAGEARCGRWLPGQGVAGIHPEEIASLVKANPRLCYHYN